MDSRELEMLRQRMAFLEQTLERCMEHIAALESRVASLEMRPIAIAPTEEIVDAVAKRIAAMPPRPSRPELFITTREEFEKVREEREIARLRRKK
jgi:hypothetical protein